MESESRWSPDVPSRRDVIACHKAGGGRVAAVFPVHYPRALLRAYGVLPVEIWGPPGQDTTLGDAHLQAYTCSIVRCGLSFALSGSLDVADVLVVPHTCDSLQGIASVLLDFLKPGQPVLPLYLPREAGEPAERFLGAEIAAMAERLAEVAGPRPSNADLVAAIEREEEADLVLAQLLRARPLLELTDRDYYRVVRSREFLPAEDFVRLARATMDRKSERPRDAVRLVLSGMVPEPMTILDVIGDAGGMVVGDDLACSGRRLYPPGRAEDPMLRMAESILGAAPCSTRGSVVDDRVRHIQRIVVRSDARAVLFHEVKFCEPEQFYLPLIRRALEREGIRSIAIEVDVSDRLPHQLVTRVEALMETAS